VETLTASPICWAVMPSRAAFTESTVTVISGCFWRAFVPTLLNPAIPRISRSIASALRVNDSASSLTNAIEMSLSPAMLSKVTRASGKAASVGSMALPNWRSLRLRCFGGTSVASTRERLTPPLALPVVVSTLTTSGRAFSSAAMR